MASSVISKVDQVPTANIAKINGITYDSTGPVAGEVKRLNGIGVKLTDIPVGLIVPYTAGAGGAPSNWSIFATADGNYIVGAGSTYAVAATGGTGDITVTTADMGNDHTGAADITDTATNGGQWRNSSSEGSHTHNFALTYTPPYQECYLIKAGATPGTEFPAGSVLFTYDADKSSIATNIWTDGYMFKANSAVGTGGSDSPSETSDAGGSHGHGGVDSGNGSGSEAAVTSGGHTHTETFTMTNNLYRAAVAAWSDAVSAVVLDEYGSGIIAMYENTTPPSGWSLCDGTGGTPDLRDYFLRPITFASAGSKSGDGSVDYVTAGTLTHAAHGHRDGNGDGGSGGTSYHQATETLTAHTQINDSEAGWMPSYYALAFIMYDG